MSQNTPPTQALSRRHILKGLLAAAAFPLAGGAPLGCKSLPGPTDIPSSEQVLVIGAGMAGLAAARALKDAGISVTVLEGRDRIGGRIWTDRSALPIPIDLGASWIHGTNGNPLVDLAASAGASTLVTDYDDGVMYEGSQPLRDEDYDAAYDQFEALIAEVNDRRRERERGEEEDIGLGVIIDSVLDDWALSETDLQRLITVFNIEIEQEYATDVANLSLYYWDAGAYVRGDDVIFPGGYDQLPEALAQGLDIRLGHGVQAIEYDETGVRVQTSQGVFEGGRVIITLPLGVLKGGSVTFDPPLPESHTEAISALGVGLLDKLYLSFPRAFWNDSTFIANVSETKGSWSFDLNMNALVGEPVLLCFNSAASAQALSSATDEARVAQAMERLRTQYGDDIPEPRAWRSTAWAKDPFALGAYSYLAVDATPAHRVTLGAPVGDRLFFAGEATHTDYPSTVHGALLSGEREASRWAAVGLTRPQSLPSRPWRPRGRRPQTKE